MRRIVKGDSSGPIVYIWDGYPIDSSGTRLVSNLSDYFPFREVIAFLWDRGSIGRPTDEKFGKYRIVRIPCKGKKVGYGRNIRMSHFGKEYANFGNTVTKFLKSMRPSIIIFAEWKSLVLLNLITHSDFKVIYLVKDMPGRFFTKWIETISLKRNRIDAVWTHSPYFNGFYSDFTDNIRTIRVVPAKAMFEKAGVPSIVRDQAVPFRIIFNGMIRYVDNLIATCDAVEDFHGQVEFHVYGYASNDDTLINYIREKQLEYTIYHGRYDYDSTPELIKSHDCVNILYYNSRNAKYALANKLYEAILFERPILATQGTKTCEIATKYGIGVCVQNPKDPKSVRLGIERLLVQDTWDFTQARKWIQPYETEFLRAVEALA